MKPRRWSLTAIGRIPMVVLAVALCAIGCLGAAEPRNEADGDGSFIDAADGEDGADGSGEPEDGVAGDEGADEEPGDDGSAGPDGEDGGDDRQDPLIVRIHPNLDDARQDGFDLLAGPPPFCVTFHVDIQGTGGFNCTWDFDGDDQVDSNGPCLDDVIHCYQTPGEYIAHVVVTDSLDQTAADQQRIVVIGEPSIEPGKRGVDQSIAWDPEDQRIEIINRMEAASVQWVRLSFRWNEIEPAHGTFNYATHDPIVQLLREKNIAVEGSLGGCNQWATSNDCSTGSYPPDDYMDFANFMYELADHYKGRVNTWIIRNEPNLVTYWPPVPNAEEYVQFLCMSYYAAKYANPQSAIVGGALSGNGVSFFYVPGSEGFLEKMYTAGALGCFDVLDIHPYVSPGVDPDPISEGLAVLQGFIDETRSMMNTYGDTSRLWLGEIGWSTVKQDGSPSSVTEERIGEWLTTVYQGVSGVEKIFWYNFKDRRTVPTKENRFGLLNYDLTPKPAYDAYDELTP